MRLIDANQAGNIRSVISLSTTRVIATVNELRVYERAFCRHSCLGGEVLVVQDDRARTRASGRIREPSSLRMQSRRALRVRIAESAIRAHRWSSTDSNVVILPRSRCPHRATRDRPCTCGHPSRPRVDWRFSIPRSAVWIVFSQGRGAPAEFGPGAADGKRRAIFRRFGTSCWQAMATVSICARIC